MSQARELGTKICFLILLISALLASPTIAGAEPGCIPAVFGQTISYGGLMSGCSNQPGNNRACLAGETIAFSVAVPQAPHGTCPISYIWQFEDGPVVGQETINHQLPVPGTYTVQVSIYDSAIPVVLTQPVTVVSPSSITALGTLARIALLMSMATLAIIRVR